MMANYVVNSVAPCILCIVAYLTIFQVIMVLEAWVGHQLLSGHIFVGFLSAGSCLSTFCYIQYYKPHFTRPVYLGVATFTWLYIAHMAYSLFWTAFVFHSKNDSTGGWAYGSACAWLLFYCDSTKTNLARLIYYLTARDTHEREIASVF